MVNHAFGTKEESRCLTQYQELFFASSDASECAHFVTGIFKRSEQFLSHAHPAGTIPTQTSLGEDEPLSKGRDRSPDFPVEIRFGFSTSYPPETGAEEACEPRCRYRRFGR